MDTASATPDRVSDDGGADGWEGTSQRASVLAGSDSDRIAVCGHVDGCRWIWILVWRKRAGRI